MLPSTDPTSTDTPAAKIMAGTDALTPSAPSTITAASLPPTSASNDSNGAPANLADKSTAIKPSRRDCADAFLAAAQNRDGSITQVMRTSLACEDILGPERMVPRSEFFDPSNATASEWVANLNQVDILAAGPPPRADDGSLPTAAESPHPAEPEAAISTGPPMPAPPENGSSACASSSQINDVTMVDAGPVFDECSAAAEDTSVPVAVGHPDVVIVDAEDDSDASSEEGGEAEAAPRIVHPAGSLSSAYACGGELGMCPGCKLCIEEPVCSRPVNYPRPFSPTGALFLWRAWHATPYFYIIPLHKHATRHS